MNLDHHSPYHKRNLKRFESNPGVMVVSFHPRLTPLLYEAALVIDRQTPDVNFSVNHLIRLVLMRAVEQASEAKIEKQLRPFVRDMLADGKGGQESRPFFHVIELSEDDEENFSETFWLVRQKTDIDVLATLVFNAMIKRMTTGLKPEENSQRKIINDLIKIGQD